MKIFVTGAEGFVGKNFVSQAEKKGIKVIGVDFKKSNKKNIIKADICSKNIGRLIPHKADVLIHLAALSRDSDCQKNVYGCFKTNVLGTLNLIRASEEKKVKQFIFASSEWVYDNCGKGKVKDEESFINIVNHTSEYALSKLVSEASLRQKYQSGFCPATILRFGIIYGSRKTNWSAVESLFNAVNTQDKVVVGSLKTGRFFIHVSDIVCGIIKSIGLKGFNIINLSGGKLITLKDIIKTSKKILNKDPKVREKNPDNISIRNISSKKAKKLLNWQPEIDLETGLINLL